MVESDRSPLHSSLTGRKLATGQGGTGNQWRSPTAKPARPAYKIFCSDIFRIPFSRPVLPFRCPGLDLVTRAWAAAARPSEGPPSRPSPPLHPAARLTSRSTRHRDSPRAQPRDGPRSHVGREKVRVGAPARRLASRARFRFRPQVNLRSFHFGKTPCSRPTQLTPMHPFSGLSQRGPLLGGSQPPPPHRAAAIARAHGTPVSRPPGLPPGC